MNINTILIGVYGASGFGKEVAPLVKSQFSGKIFDIVFIDDAPEDNQVNDISVITFDEFLKFSHEKKLCSIAIANTKARNILSERLATAGIEEISVKASNVVILDDVQIDQGSILCPFVTLTSNIKVGKNFHANLYSYVGHDCIIGDRVTFAPAVKCNGNVVIEDDVYIGTGAIIKQGRPGKPLVIGKGAVVGMGAVVTKNVPPGITVIGNPAKPLSRESLK